VAGGAVLGMLALALPAVRHLRETSPPETRVDIVTPATLEPTSFALSPDGRQLVFLATAEDGRSRLWLRSLAATRAEALAGTEDAFAPFWSPDGRALGFFVPGALKRLDLGGGAPQTLAPLRGGGGHGGAWGADDVVVFSDFGNPLQRVAASGGEVAPVTTLGPRQSSHYFPHLLPDGRHVLFYVQDGSEPGVYLGDLEGGAPIRLTDADSGAVYLPSGWLLWVRAGTLMAQRLDVGQAKLTGALLTLADGVPTTVTGRGAFTVSATGLVAYRERGQTDERQLTWVDRTGTVLGTLGDADGSLTTPRVAPDGQRVAVVRGVLQSSADLWLLDDVRTSRLTFDASADSYPVWSADSSRLVFASNRAGQLDLYQKLASGTGAEEVLFSSDESKYPSSLTADGRFLLYFTADEQGTDLWVLATAGNGEPTPFLQTPFNERWGAFSPDGRWVAYISNESGRDEIYVRPFVPPGEESTAAVTVGQWQVSTAGGHGPLWSPDGQELYYLNAEGGMMAAAVSASTTEFAAGTPELLFATRIAGGGVATGQGRQYDVAADGRFLINTVPESATAAPITLIQNWNPQETP
jgi:Tol biopolymer transport system component